MRLVGPYGVKGMGALAIGDEFIIGRTGFSVNRYDYGISEAIGAAQQWKIDPLSFRAFCTIIHKITTITNKKNL